MRVLQYIIKAISRYILDNTENNTFNFVDIKCRCPSLI
jgi:hypothetical protein